MMATRTGLFPTVKELPRPAVKQTAITSRNTPSNNVKTPARSILKRKSDVVTTEKKCGSTPAAADRGHHVQFKSRKDTEQESLRAKLNSWLEAKGKTPSRCRHMMCFNAQVSAVKKTTGIKLTDRTITQNLLSHQFDVLEKEEGGAEAKKELDDVGPPQAKKSRQSDEKENHKARKSIHFVDEEISFKETQRNEEPQSPSLPQSNEQSASSKPQQPEPSDTNGPVTSDIGSFLDILLKECLTLYDGGWPVDKILPWLTDIETHIPEARSFAPFYVCKAKVLAAFPQQVLDVYCQAVRNNAQPRDLLASEMKSSLSLLMVPPPPIPPPKGLYCGEEYLNISLPQSIQQQSPAGQYGTPTLSLLHRSRNCSSANTSRGWISDVNDTTNFTNTSAEDYYSTDNNEEEGSALSEVNSESYCTDGTHSVLSSGGSRRSASQSDFSLPASPTQCSTPVEQQVTATSSTASGGLGSQVRYVISSRPPLLRKTPEGSPVAVVTPVRRSVRLSGRQLTPGVALRREITSTSELTQNERRTMLFQPNHAITGDR